MNLSTGTAGTTTASTTPTPTQQPQPQLPQPQQPQLPPPANAGMDDGSDELLAEGYLKKIRGFGRNRIRWFRLTAQFLAYYTVDGGSLIAYVPRAAISGVDNLPTTTRFVVRTKQAFGATGGTDMLLEAKNAKIKAKWLLSLRKIPGSSRGVDGDEGRLYAEGYLNKLQPFGSMNRIRWFSLTEKRLAYYTQECEEVMAAVHCDNIAVVLAQDNDTFIIKATHPFTASGSDTLVCQGENPGVMNRWINQLENCLGKDRIRTHVFSPLPQNTRDIDDHFSVMTKQQWEYTGTNSEGNRFISDREL